MTLNCITTNQNKQSKLKYQYRRIKWPLKIKIVASISFVISLMIFWFYKWIWPGIKESIKYNKARSLWEHNYKEGDIVARIDQNTLDTDNYVVLRCWNVVHGTQKPYHDVHLRKVQEAFKGPAPVIQVKASLLMPLMTKDEDNMYCVSNTILSKRRIDSLIKPSMGNELDSSESEYMNDG